MSHRMPVSNFGGQDNLTIIKYYHRYLWDQDRQFRFSAIVTKEDISQNQMIMSVLSKRKPIKEEVEINEQKVSDIFSKVSR